MVCMAIMGFSKNFREKTNISSGLFLFWNGVNGNDGFKQKFREKKTNISSLKFQNDPSGLQLLSFEMHPQSNRFFFFRFLFQRNLVA